MRYLAIVALICVSQLGLAQSPGSRGYQNPFLRTQWYLGFYAGGNYAKGVPITSYSGIAPINYNASDNDKVYSGFTKMGAQAGLVFMFYTSGFSIALKPGITTYSIEHMTALDWVESSNITNSLAIAYEHDTRFNYVEFPLSVHYDLGTGKLRPYVGVGGYYGILINATRDINRSGTDTASGSTGSFKDQPNTIGISDLYIKSSLGAFAYLGGSYDPGNIRITLDIGYKFGLNNITNTGSRYLNNDLAAIGEAMDDLKLQSLYFSVGFVFPLKFISKNYSSF